MTHSPVTGGLKPTVTSGLGSVEFGTDTVTYFTRSVMREESARMVGEVADFTGLSIRTLRHYDDIGIVVPSGHTAGGFRLYTDADIDRLLLVRRMKPLGFSLERMKQFLEATDILTAAQRSESPGLDDWHAARMTVEEIRAEAEARYLELQTQLEYSAEFLQLFRQRFD